MSKRFKQTKSFFSSACQWLQAHNCRSVIIGVRKQFRGRGVNLAMAARSYLAMIERGYKTGSYTIVLDDNWPSRRTAEKLGGRVTRNSVIYRREFG